MGQNFRKTGIDFMGDVPWGAHFCQFYQTQEDLIDILVPYFKAGLENNESCIWVTSEPLGEKGAKEAMRKTVPNFDLYLNKGQIEIVPHTGWYLKDGAFNLQRVLNAWIDKLNQALAKGYEGLRLAGNTAWLEKRDWRNFADYEEQVNKVIGKYQMIAICTYSLNRCGASELLDVVRHHQFTLIRREGEWELIESFERKWVEEALAEERNLLRIIMENVPDWIFFKDAKSRFIRINGALAQLLGIADSKEAVGKTDFDFFPQEDAQRSYEEEQKIIQSGKPVVARVGKTSNREGNMLWVSETKMPLRDETGKVVGLVGISRDISELAYHDSVTGLPKRRLFKDRLTLELAHAERNRQKLVVMLFDLDRFKEINYRLGHRVGDRMLQAVGDRLTRLLRKSDTFARMGDHEFVLVLPEITRVEDPAEIAWRILEELQKPFVFVGHEVNIRTSIGIVIYPNDGKDVNTLVNNADIAMRRARARGGNNYQYYTPTGSIQEME